MSGLLSPADFLAVVRDAPLVSIDIIVRDAQGLVLLGHRRNAPARGWWFVPGGRIRKSETLAAAFKRITREELGHDVALESASLKGVYEHFYTDNFAAEEGIGTHYVVLAYELNLDDVTLMLPVAQHDRYRWSSPVGIAEDTEVHLNTRSYFK